MFTQHLLAVVDLPLKDRHPVEQALLINVHARSLDLLDRMRGRHHQLGEQSCQARMRDKLLTELWVDLVRVTYIVTVVRSDTTKRLRHDFVWLEFDHPLVDVSPEY